MYGMVDFLSMGEMVAKITATILVFSYNYLVRKKLIQHTDCLLHNDRADAITIDDTDGDGFLFRKVRLLCGHIGNSIHLLLQYGSKVFQRLFHYALHSFV